MLPFALFDSQSMFIAGVTLILGMWLLRKHLAMKKSLQKPKTREYPRHLYAMQASDFGLPASGNSTQNYNQAEINQSNYQTARNVSEEELTTSLRSQYEQFDVELLTLSRQIKAEIDTKIIALQLMIADADCVLQQWEGQLPYTRQTTASTPHPAEHERMRILKAEETTTATNITHEGIPHSALPHSGDCGGVPPSSPAHCHSLHTPHSPHDPGDIKNLVVEDPFAVGDFGFDKAMRDLDQLSSSIPTFDAMRSLDSWDTPKSESPASLPEWDTPLSYPISDYRPAQDRPTPPIHDTPAPNAVHSVASKTNRRKTTYTNKLLTQAPPQLDTLMTNKPVGKMGSKPRRMSGQASPNENAPLVPPMIPKSPPPSAKALFVESPPLIQTEVGDDKISIRKGRRHQLQYLIEKGMSPKEIAAHLEMPVGEVELIFSLHKRNRLQASDSRLQEEVAKSEPEARSPRPEAQSPRIIAAENIVM